MADESQTLIEGSPLEEATESPAEAFAEMDYGKWGELLPKELQDALVKLDEHFTDQFKYPRRLEIMNAWKARSFGREMQHLNGDWGGECWEVTGPAGWSGSP